MKPERSSTDRNRTCSRSRSSGVDRRVCFALRCCRALSASLPSPRLRRRRADPLPSWNDGPAKQAIVDFVQRDHDQGEPEVRARRRSASPRSTRTARCGSSIPMYTQVIYCLERVPAVREGEARTRERRAVQDRAVRQPRGDREALDAGPREDPRRDADRHDGRGVQRRSEEVARRRPRIRAGSGPTPSSPISRCRKC